MEPDHHQSQISANVPLNKRKILVRRVFANSHLFHWPSKHIVLMGNDLSKSQSAVSVATLLVKKMNLEVWNKS